MKVTSETPKGATHYSSEYKDCTGDWWFKSVGYMFYVWIDCFGVTEGAWMPTSYHPDKTIALEQA